MSDLILQAGSATHDPIILQCPKCMCRFRPNRDNIERAETDIGRGCSCYSDNGLGCYWGCYPTGSVLISETVKCPTPNCPQNLKIRHYTNQSSTIGSWCSVL